MRLFNFQLILLASAACVLAQTAQPTTPPSQPETTKAEAEKVVKPKEEESVLLDPEKVVWVYESRAELPTPEAKLAKYISADFASLDNEFEKDEMLQKIRPIMQRKMEEAKKTNRVYVKINHQLQNYDFEKNGFPTNVDEATFIPLGEYVVQFANAEKLSFLPTDKEKAKKMVSILKNNRSCTLEIYGEIQEVSTKTINHYMCKTILMNPKKIRIVIDPNKGSKIVQECEI